MIAKDHYHALTMLGSTLALVVSGAVQAGGHEDAPVAVTAITQEDIEQSDAKSLQELLPELVTTARRDEENILEVPLSITSFSADKIENAAITTIDDVAAQTPGLSFANFFGQDLQKATIRGVPPLDIFGESNTAIFIDGVYVSSETAVNFSFVDVERIEVLKGPQGAYFGNNAFSGAINYVTAKPSNEFGIKSELRLGDYGKRLVRGSLEGPLVDNVLTGRISASYDEFDGTYDDKGPFDRDIGGYKFKTVTGSLYFTPTENLSAMLNLYVSDDHIDPPALFTTPANCEPSLNPDDNGAFLNYCGEVPGVGKNRLQTIPGETGQVRDIVRTTLKVDWDTSVGTFSSLTGMSTTKDASLQNGNPGRGSTIFQYGTTDDFGTTPFPPFFPLFGLDTFDAGGLLITSAGKAKNEDFSQELRFTSPRENRVRYTAGLYYFDQEFDAPSPNISVQAENPTPDDFAFFCPVCASFGPGAFNPAGVPVGSFIFGSWFSGAPITLDSVRTTETTDKAVFGSVEFDISDVLTGYAEVRYTDREVKISSVDAMGVSQPIGVGERNDTDYTTWRTSLTYALNDTSNIYGSIATGEKGGGIDSYEIEGTSDAMLNGTIIAVPFAPEENITYELGYKGTFNDGRVVFDGAIYYIDWDELVLRTVLTEEPGGLPMEPKGVSLNAGDAKIKGAEFGLTAQVTDLITVGLGASYNDTELNRGENGRFADFPSFGDGITADVSGQDLPRQPDTQVNANITFRDQFRGDWEWYARGDAFYQSKWYVDLPNQAEIPSRTTANARIGLESEAYTIELYSNNVFDDDTPTSAYRDPYFTNITQDGSTQRLFPWRMTVGQAQGRTMGVRLIGRFGGSK